MDRRHQGLSRSWIGSTALTLMYSMLLFGGMLLVTGCGDDQGDGMIADAKDVTKTQDAQDSMNAYMKSMKSKGMKPGLKSAPAEKAQAK